MQCLVSEREIMNFQPLFILVATTHVLNLRSKPLIKFLRSDL